MCEKVNKRLTKFKWIILVCLIIGFLIWLFCACFGSYTEYTFSAQACEHYFGYTPEDLANELDGTGVKAWVDSDGNFVEWFTNGEIQIMRFLYVLDIWNARMHGIEISSDYTEIYFEADPVTYSDYERISRAMSACVGLRRFRGEENIDYRMVVIDTGTGETTTHDRLNYPYSYETRSILSLFENTE